MKKITLAAVAVMALGATASFAASEGSWGYEGKSANWGALDKSNVACDEGRLQSPFDIKANFKTSLPAINFDYMPAELNVKKNSHGVTVSLMGGQKMSVAGDDYKLLQYHFHAPSEYHLNGKSFPMAMHLVHQRIRDGALGVVGVFIKEGKKNSVIDSIWSNLPKTDGEAKVKGVNINPADLLPDAHRYVRFSGSLTTPPCSEGVNWHVMETPIEASAEQIAAFKGIVKMNARPLQPTNNRLIVAE